MFRQILSKVSAWARKFMEGRYGTDQLNMAILSIGLALCVISLFVRRPQVNLLLTALSYGFMIWAIFRSFSRNTYRRYQENRKYRQFFDRLKDREHRYFDCPKCHQPVRVPRKKGKIAITCPRCQKRFIRKS